MDSASRPLRVRVVGPGRAGGALALALGSAGWHVDGPLGRDDDLRACASGVDLVLIATPDAAVGDVAASIAPDPGGAVIAHVAGSLGLDVLAPHERRGSLHPLVALPSAAVGARRLHGAWWAVAGDPLVEQVVDALDGRQVRVDDDQRAAYHAAACIASNHLVVLLAQVERVASSAGVPLEAYLDLVRATVDNVAELGPAAALTGPAARGDEATIRRHREALGADELDLYDPLVAGARRLADEQRGLPS